MFFKKDRLRLFRKMILCDSKPERSKYLTEVRKVQEKDFLLIFRLMHDKPITIRLLDPPLHEFLPDLTLTDEINSLVSEMGIDENNLRMRIKSLHEVNPMLGFRGCRLSILFPEITDMQIRAITTAAVMIVREGFNVFPEVMIPLICTNHEVDMITPSIISAYHTTIEDIDLRENGSVTSETDRLKKCIDLKIGVMLETPRSCKKLHKPAINTIFNICFHFSNIRHPCT